MNQHDRQEQLRKKPFILFLWYALVALEVANVLVFVYRLAKYFLDPASPVYEPGSSAALILAGSVTVTFLTFWIAWGIWRIERWVMIPIFISLIWSLISGSVIGVIITAVVGIGYQAILMTAYQKKSLFF